MTITANTRAHRRYWPEVGPDVPLTSPVPRRTGAMFCSLCGLEGPHDRVHFGCDGQAPEWGYGAPEPRDPADPPRRPWVDAALAYRGDV